MIPSLELHEDADRELGDAAEYYEGESPGLGATFLDEVESGLARIVKHPSVGPELAKGIRKLVLARFPYSLIYEVGASRVFVLAIAHQRKRPFYWRGRS